MPEVDPNVTATAPTVDTQSMPVNEQLQTPPAAAPSQSLNLVPPPASAPPPAATSKNSSLHNLIGSVLGGLAGPAPVTYSTDANGKLIASAPKETFADKARRIGQHALIGLSAASQGGPQKSGLASALSGAGAGAKAVAEKEEKQDILKRSQEKENFEEQQQAMLRKHEIARSNALTYATQLENEKRQNDLNPIYAQNESLFKAVKDSPELGAHAHEISGEQALAEAEKDPTFLHTHIVKPMGKIPVTDENGQPVMVTGEDGVPAPKMQMRFMVLDGTQDGKVKVTPELAQDIKAYGSMARIPNFDAIKAGDEYEISQLVPVMNKVEEQRKSVLDGWQKAEMGWQTDPNDPKKEVPVLINKVMPPGSPDSIRKLTVKPMALAAEEGKTELQKAQAMEAYGKGKEALANAALISGSVGAGNQASIPAYLEAIKKLPDSSQAILRNVSPQVQMSLLKLSNGDVKLNEAFPTRVTKGSGQLDAEHAANLATLLNPQWTGGLADTKKTAAKSFADGEDGKAIASLGQFFVHADDARMASERLARTNSPLLNRPINWIRTEAMGQPGVPSLMASIQTARSEWQNFIKNGHAADLADTEQSRAILSDKSSPAQVMDALREMGRTGVGRIDQIDAKWRRTWGGHYPGLISDTGRQAAINLGLGELIKDYPSESGAMFGVQPVGGNQIQSPDNPASRPKGTTGIAPGSDGKMYYHDIKGNILGEAPAGIQ